MSTHAPTAAPTTPRQPAAAPAWAGVVVLTALAYFLVGWAALTLAGPPGFAAPLYPAAGIALAAALSFGRAACFGVWIGAFAVNFTLGWVRGQSGVACSDRNSASTSIWLLP